MCTVHREYTYIHSLYPETGKQRKFSRLIKAKNSKPIDVIQCLSLKVFEQKVVVHLMDGWLDRWMDGNE